MLDSGLFRLFQLHHVDAALQELKAHAAALDVGQEDARELKAKMEEFEPVRALARALRQEQTDLELKQKQLQDKKKASEKKLYDGSMVNSREIAALEKEIALLGEQIDAADMRLLELLDEVPAAQQNAKKAEIILVKIQKRIQEKKEAAQEEHKKLQADYAALSQKRAPAWAKVPKTLLDPYEALKGKIGAPAMAVVNDQGRCGACGILVPERAREMVRQDRMVPCESCKRYLFIAVPAP
jgi:hypothetical protein